MYEVGYLIADFIVARVSRDGLRALIGANRQLATIGFGAPSEFDAAWAGWVRDRYSDQPRTEQ